MPSRFWVKGGVILFCGMTLVLFNLFDVSLIGFSEQVVSESIVRLCDRFIRVQFDSLGTRVRKCFRSLLGRNKKF